MMKSKLCMFMFFLATASFAAEKTTPYPTITKPGEHGVDSIQSALVSLRALSRAAELANYSPDQIEEIQANLNNLTRIVQCTEFYPISKTNTLKTTGTCGSWHEFPCLDNKCWAKETCLFLNFDKIEPCQKNDCCCGSVFRVVSWSTLGLYPALTGIPSLLAGGFQALVYAGSLPIRGCGSCDEYEYQTHVNNPLLKNFIMQYAIKVRKVVQDNNIQLSDEEIRELEALSK